MSSPPGGDIEINTIQVNSMIPDFSQDCGQVFIRGEEPTINTISDAKEFVGYIFNLYFVDRNNEDFGFDNYIKNKISIETAEIIIDKLSHCNCCPRHCYLRPIKLEKFTYNQSFVAKPICNCQCNCRHTARFICNAFYD